MATITRVSERQEILEQVRGSLALEGLQASDEMNALMDRWAAGAVSTDDLRAAADQAVADAKQPAARPPAAVPRAV